MGSEGTGPGSVPSLQVGPLEGREVKARRGKYGNRKTAYKGSTYDSGAEAFRAAGLDLLVKAGKIDGWFRGERDLIADGGVGKRVWYRPDFMVWKDKDHWVEDVKAQDRKTGKAIVTQGFRLKAILWGIHYPDLPLRVVNKHGQEIWKLK